MGTVMSPSGNSTSSIIIGTPGYMPTEQLAGRPMFSSVNNIEIANVETVNINN